ncbi:MAG: signal transduction histidine kinase [Proteobacteria bacterium]|nr:signal transduction histidine kinase [Pseudomonadota bacterium]
MTPDPALTLARRFIPRTLLVRTFLLVSVLIFVCVATWLTLFALAEREPRARELAQLTVSIVNLTQAALVAADPDKRLALLRDLAESEGVHLYPAEPTDNVSALPDTFFFRVMLNTAQSQLGSGTRFARSVNGQTGIWVSFSIGDSSDDEYWLMLPGEHAESDFPWSWLGWGGASLALALLVAWLIVSRVTQPLRALAAAAHELGRGQHPDPVAERGAIELKQLAEAFNRMSNDLKRLDAERAEVLAGISHDLRTPLARLRLEAEMSISDALARSAVSDDIEQMDAIIAQFLDYARDESEERAEPTDVNALVTQLAGAQGRTARDVVLRLGEVPRALIYHQALARALSNLLENARKYGGGEITVDTRRENDDIVIDVLDRGPGIAASQIERLKRPFTRLETARSDATGTGLGLAIVERIARLHEGTLELLPRDGGGLTARLRLPLKRRP